MKRHLLRAVAALLAFTGLAFTTTACNPAIDWQMGSTHGVIYEAGALRGSMNVYRVPRSLLMKVWNGGGMQPVMDSMWQFGRPPRFSMCAFGKVCYSTDIVASKIHGWIYGDPWDLKGALFDAQANYDCLALTIISGGAYNKNWTHKGIGCYLGSLPSTTRSLAQADTPQPPASGVETVEGAEPLDPNDYVPGSGGDPGPAEPVPFNATVPGG